MTGTITVNRNHISNFPKGIKLDGTEVTATAAEINAIDGITADVDEINILDGVTATTEEINAVDGAALSMTTTATKASGTCAVQLVFKDAAGVTMAVPTSGFLYISEVATGLSNDPVDGLAVLTNGALDELVTGGASIYTTTAAGLLGLTISHSGADMFWVVVVLPSGKLLISDQCEVE